MVRNYLTTSHAKSILKLGIPIMLGQAGVILVGFIDNIMVGHYGTGELAAASFVNNFVNLAFILGVGFSLGLTPLVAGSFASGNGQLRILLKSSVVCNLLVGIILTLFISFFYWKLEWLNQPAELIPIIKPYYLIQILSIIPLMLFNAYKQFVDGLGCSMTGMIAVLLSNIINVILNYFLIFGKCGVPELGLLGAGIATLTARIISIIILICVVHRSKKFNVLFLESKSFMGQVSIKAMRRLFSLGTPSGLQMGLESGAFSIAVIMVGWLGPIPLAAHQVANTISTLGFMIYYGLSSAVAVRVGYFYELKDKESIRESVRSGLALHFALAGALVIFLLLTHKFIGYLFVKDEEVIQLVSGLCIILCIYQFGDVLQILYSNALRGMQDVRFTAGAAIFSYIIMTILVSYILGIKLEYGVEGIWWGFPIGLTTLGVLLYWRFKKIIHRI